MDRSRPSRHVLVTALASFLLVPATADALGTTGGYDPTFNGGKPLVVDPPSASNGAGGTSVDRLAVDGAGRIVAAGSARKPNAEADSALMVARVTPTGALDASFGEGGVFRRSFSPAGASVARGVAIAPGDAVHVGVARSPADQSALRLTAGGTADPMYGTGGVASFSVAPPASVSTATLAGAPDGTAFLLGYLSTNDPATAGQVSLTVVAPDGTLRVSGKLLSFSQSAQKYTTVNAALVDPAGRLLVTGYTDRADGRSQGFVARLDPATGARDPAFGGGDGVVHLDLTQSAAPNGFITSFRDLVVGRDGIYAVGTTADPKNHVQGLVAKLTPDGVLDAAYGTGGVVRLQLGPVGGGGYGSIFASAAPTPAGGLLVGGSRFADSLDPDATLSLLRPDGTLDPAWGREGVLELDGLSQAEAVRATGDRVVVAGRAAKQAFVARVLLAPLPDDAGPIPGPGTTPAPGTARGRATVRARRFRLDRRGRVAIRVSCPATVGPCAGGVGLIAARGKVPARAASTAVKRRRTAARYGRRAYKIAAGKRVTVRVTVARGARRTVARRGRLQARLVIRRTGGKRTTVKVTLLARKR